VEEELSKQNVWKWAYLGTLLNGCFSIWTVSLQTITSFWFPNHDQ
jgi:hypothetical protein